MCELWWDLSYFFVEHAYDDSSLYLTKWFEDLGVGLGLLKLRLPCCSLLLWNFLVGASTALCSHHWDSGWYLRSHQVCRGCKARGFYRPWNIRMLFPPFRPAALILGLAQIHKIHGARLRAVTQGSLQQSSEDVWAWTILTHMADAWKNLWSRMRIMRFEEECCATITCPLWSSRIFVGVDRRFALVSANSPIT